MLHTENLLYISEQDDRRRGVRVNLVRFNTDAESRPPSYNRKVAEALGAYGWKSHGSLLNAIF
jgi:hypothetical protein